MRVLEKKNLEKAHPPSSAELAQRRSVAPCRAVRCRALPCGAVLCCVGPCCAVLCCAFSSEHTRQQQTEWARASMSSSINTAVLSLLFPDVFRWGGGLFLFCTGTQQQQYLVVYTSMFSLSIGIASTTQHSTAQSPLHKAANQVRADQSTYPKKYGRIRTYSSTCIRRPGCIPGAWSSWHLHVAYLHLKCWTIHYICHSNPFFLVSERSGWNRPLRGAPCMYVLGSTQMPEHGTTVGPHSRCFATLLLAFSRRYPVRGHELAATTYHTTGT